MGEPTFSDVLRERRSHRDFRDATIPRKVLDRLVWAAQGTTSEDGKRTAPSAHALHPLKLTLTAGRIEGLEPAIYDVAADPKTKLSLAVAGDQRQALEAAALDDQPWVARAAGILEHRAINLQHIRRL